MSRSWADAPLDLRVLLTKLANNKTIAEKAWESLDDAAESYLHSQPLVDSTQRRKRSSIAQSRADIDSVAKASTDLQAGLSSMTVEALQALTTQMDHPIGGLQAELAKLLAAIGPTQRFLRAQPNKPPDHDLNIWAFAVGRILRDDLQTLPTTTRPNPLITGARGGAAYGRLLKASLPLIGGRSIAVGRLIDAGIKLLNDKALP